MNKFMKIVIFIIYSIALNTGNAFAGEHKETGYIIRIQANTTNYCFLELSRNPNGPNFQRGYWWCGQIAGQNLLELARTAHILKNKVTVIYEGNGEVSKPIYSIIFENK